MRRVASRVPDLHRIPSQRSHPNAEEPLLRVPGAPQQRVSPPSAAERIVIDRTATTETPMNEIATQLPGPSSKHATCAWCTKRFDNIVDLIDHVDNSHVEYTETQRRPRYKAA
jgi:hypothetical protein